MARAGDVNVPTAAEVAEGQQALIQALQCLDEAVESALLILNRISNPVERAKATLAARRHIATAMPEILDGVFADAVREAYATGRAAHGWYGYGALAEELSLSRARVQQIVNGSWKGKRNPEEAARLRAAADQSRTIRRLAAAGKTAEDIATHTGLSLPEVRDTLA